MFVTPSQVNEIAEALVSLQHGAGFPIVYAAVFHYLVEVTRLKEGELISIHAAAGGVGQGVLMLANRVGARVFTTISSESKKKILLEYGVREEDIFYSRNLDFTQMILQQTSQRRVDVVLNLLAGEALRMIFECMAPCGRFIEIGSSIALAAISIFPENVTYLVSGGLGGLGRSAARWVASRGAKHSLFLSGSGGPNADAQLLLNELKDAGYYEQILQVDISDSVALNQAIRAHTEAMPLIRCCIKSGMTLSDSTFETMTSIFFEASIRTKERGSWNLYEMLPRDLDFSLFLSSCAGVIGNRGQGNYNHPSEAVLGNQVVPQDEFHALLEYHCNVQNSDVCPRTGVGLCTREQFYADNLPEPAFLGSQGNTADGAKLSIKGSLDKARQEKALQIVVEGIIEKLSNLLAISATEIDSETPSSRYSVYSLVAIEIRKWLSKEVDMEFEVLDIGQSVDCRFKRAGARS
ncbi:Acyl transferase/acyl hydrolase/lysophospholipase [Penicillium robsamsonii]|uniref:Acyl transferase/acyl hydrolase/lysophospholipase n=1 Tax=Penicillium robsamsonii TaxID=1792511 RepID=UPI0025467D7F|nr:Acyl transferase/acyl hydrolase/lysophospholipase [Penicillium robsamsonii]KAJ5833984.1 Acyl transferase/acyl hydrolase/lysophospholipase [Penicillium robsamsonii]